MMLCLDIGNSHIFGGVFEAEKILLRFRYPSIIQCTSDQLGVFLKSVLRENDLDAKQIKKISISSVVPSLDYSVQAAISKYFKLVPFFLKAGVKTGLNITCKNPQELGADRIANAIGAIQNFPENNYIIIVDLGTATTFDVISPEKNYIGGLIMPGMKMAMKALNKNTAKLPPVNIIKPQKIIGQNTVENIQSGLYYGHLGAMREIIQKINFSYINTNINPCIIIGTGGFSQLFESEGIFNVILPDLVLQGLRLAFEKNQKIYRP